uniref:Uncharacterized protein n=1 Tax=Bracon brevicornis TaxID=1563983 RepID=A0A6V7LQD4_9HYME
MREIIKLYENSNIESETVSKTSFKKIDDTSDVKQSIEPWSRSLKKKYNNFTGFSEVKALVEIEKELGPLRGQFSELTGKVKALNWIDEEFHEMFQSTIEDKKMEFNLNFDEIKFEKFNSNTENSIENINFPSNKLDTLVLIQDSTSTSEPLDLIMENEKIEMNENIETPFTEDKILNASKKVTDNLMDSQVYSQVRENIELYVNPRLRQNSSNIISPEFNISPVLSSTNKLASSHSTQVVSNLEQDSYQFASNRSSITDNQQISKNFAEPILSKIFQESDEISRKISSSILKNQEKITIVPIIFHDELPMHDNPSKLLKNFELDFLKNFDENSKANHVEEIVEPSKNDMEREIEKNMSICGMTCAPEDFYPPYNI